MLEHLSVEGTRPARVVVIGAAGFVGAAVARRAAQAGVPVLAVTRSQGDLLADDAADRLAALLRPGDAVVAAAARAPCRDGAMLVENMRLAGAITAALAAVPVAHVVNISSDAVYADGPVPLHEATPAAPESLHGAMHLAREILFRGEVGAPLAVLRPTLLYGAADPHDGYGPNRFRRLAAAGQAITLFGDGEERRDHVLIDDLAELTWRVLERRSRGTLTVATGAVHSFRAIAEQIAALAGWPVPIRATPRQGPMPHGGYRPFDIAACRAAFPDFRYTPLAQGLARAQREMPARSEEAAHA
jgi:nucleoside-diphosphate-sugar epimerase